MARDLQIGSRAIETFQDGLFGRVVEVGLYKNLSQVLLPESFRFFLKISKTERAAAFPPPYD